MRESVFVIITGDRGIRLLLQIFQASCTRQFDESNLKKDKALI